jgi:RNA polymerase sigma-70 factor, ECF subfamily
MSTALDGDRYQPGDPADFERLYAATYERLLFVLLAILRDRAAAEDCLQEAAARAYRAWPRWKPDAPPEAWLHRIALNVAFRYRRRERRAEVGEVIRRLGRPAPERGPDEHATAGGLFDALNKLDAADASLIVLRHHHGYSNREIAAALRLPESTVSSRLVAAKRKLRAELERREIVTPATSGVVSSENP